MNNYNDYLKNKKVILVGPSDILNDKNDKNLGLYINSFDIVVRMNNSYPVNINNDKIKREVGNRTDILYHTGAINTCLRIASNKHKFGRIQLLKNDGVKWLTSKRDNINGTDRDKYFMNKFIKINDLYNAKINPPEKIKIFSIHPSIIKELRQLLLGSDPNMSTLAIIHLLTFDIKSLDIIGCDFYSSGYHEFYTLPSHIKWNNKSKKLVRKDGKKRRKPRIPHNYGVQIELLLNIFKNDKRVNIDKDIIKKWEKHLR